MTNEELLDKIMYSQVPTVTILERGEYRAELLRLLGAAVSPQPDKEMLEAIAEDGLLVTWDKDFKFSFSQVVRLMAEFVIEHPWADAAQEQPVENSPCTFDECDKPEKHGYHTVNEGLPINLHNHKSEPVAEPASTAPESNVARVAGVIAEAIHNTDPIYRKRGEPASTGEPPKCSCPCHKGESVICNCGGGFECEYINSIPVARPSGPSAPQIGDYSGIGNEEVKWTMKGLTSQGHDAPQTSAEPRPEDFRCCDNGNFGTLHDCQKSNPAARNQGTISRRENEN